MNDGGPGIIRFGDCELDLAARELRRGGRPVTAQPKVLELIAYLIDHRDRAIGKNELQEAIWPGVIVNETSLTQAIRKARRALGDDAEHQSIIRTVHGHGYRFVADITGSTAASDAPTFVDHADEKRPTIAVLPFVNLSGDAAQEYFSDAITVDIITRLSKHRGLVVLARNTTFGYKASPIDVRKLARELGASYVVEGTVRKAANRIRVTAQLVDGSSGNHLWAERYDRDLEDVFEVQDDITDMIVARLEPEISSAERQKVARAARADLQAWDCFHLGVAHFFKFTAADNRTAQQLLNRARELDAQFGEAHAWWAYAVVLGMVYWETAPSQALLDEALEATQRALQIDDQNAVFYALKARVQLARGEYDSAQRENEIAIRMNPTLAAAHCGLGDTLAYQGRYEAAVSAFERAIDMSPNDPQRWAFLSYGALALIFKRDFAVALEWAERAMEIPNCQYWAQAHRAVALAYLDRYDDAKEAVAALLRDAPGFSCAFAAEKLFFVKDAEQRDLYIAGLRRAGLADS